MKMEAECRGAQWPLMQEAAIDHPTEGASLARAKKATHVTMPCWATQ